MNINTDARVEDATAREKLNKEFDIMTQSFDLLESYGQELEYVLAITNSHYRIGDTNLIYIDLTELHNQMSELVKGNKRLKQFWFESNIKIFIGSLFEFKSDKRWYAVSYTENQSLLEVPDLRFIYRRIKNLEKLNIVVDKELLSLPIDYIKEEYLEMANNKFNRELMCNMVHTNYNNSDYFRPAPILDFYVGKNVLNTMFVSGYDLYDKKQTTANLLQAISDQIGKDSMDFKILYDINCRGNVLIKSVVPDNNLDVWAQFVESVVEDPKRIYPYSYRIIEINKNNIIYSYMLNLDLGNTREDFMRELVVYFKRKHRLDVKYDEREFIDIYTTMSSIPELNDNFEDFYKYKSVVDSILERK